MGATASISSVVIVEKSVQKSVVKSVNEVALKNATAVIQAADVDSIAKLDSFAKEMFIRSPKVEGLNHLLLSHHGREAFMKFLRNEYVYAMQNYALTVHLSSVKSKSRQSDHNLPVSDMPRRTYGFIWLSMK